MLTQEAIFIATIKGTSLVIKTRLFSITLSSTFNFSLCQLLGCKTEVWGGKYPTI